MTREDFKDIYFDMEVAARDINQKKAQFNEESSFEEKLTFVRETLKKLFGVKGTDEKLINLLTYDAYQFLINFKGDFVPEYSVDGDGFRELSLTEDGNSLKLTGAFYTDGPYYGSFNVNYANGVSRSFRFDANSLTLNGNVITPENISAEVLGNDSSILEYSSSNTR